jgi:hypothetical protein
MLKDDDMNHVYDTVLYSMSIPKSMMGTDDILNKLEKLDDFEKEIEEFSKYYDSTTLVERVNNTPLGMLIIKNVEKISIIDTRLKIYTYPNEYHIQYTSPTILDPKTFKPMTKSGKIILSRIPDRDGYWILGDKRDGSIYKQKLKMDTIKDIHKCIGKIWEFIYNLYR